MQKHTLKAGLGPNLDFGGGGDDINVDPGVSKRSQSWIKTEIFSWGGLIEPQTPGDAT